MNKETEQLVNRYRGQSTPELEAMLEKPEDWTPEAIDAAKLVLRLRKEGEEVLESQAVEALESSQIGASYVEKTQLRIKVLTGVAFGELVILNFIHRSNVVIAAVALTILLWAVLAFVARSHKFAASLSAPMSYLITCGATAVLIVIQGSEAFRRSQLPNFSGASSPESGESLLRGLYLAAFFSLPFLVSFARALVNRRHFQNYHANGEQDGAGQPATRSDFE